MAAPVPSPTLQQLANTFRLLSLRSDIDGIILELLGQFTLEKIYADADQETYQTLVVTLLAQLNAIFGIQRLTIPSENLQVGWYLEFLASWEVTLRTIEFVLQVVVEGRESLWEARLLREKYLADFLLNALRFLTLHPKIPSNQRAKDQRDRFSRIHQSLERIFDSYPATESFLLLVCRDITDSLRAHPNGLALPPRLRTELPNVATGLYPLPECLQSRYISTIVPQDGLPGDWLSQFYTLRDISQFVVGASVQYTGKREERDMHLQVNSANTRNAVLHSLEFIQMPQHLNRIELVATFAEIFRVILPDTLNIGRREPPGSHLDEIDIDALDALCTRLSDRQIINRSSDHEMMSSISKVTREIELLDDPRGHLRASGPKLYAVNCKRCHIVGDSQLRISDNHNFSLDDREESEIILPLKSKCIICGEGVTMMREILAVRHTWDILKPLESNTDTTSVERHLPSQFQLVAPKAETGMPFHPAYSGILAGGRHRSPDGEPSSPPHTRSVFQASPERSRSIQQTLISPLSPGSRDLLETSQNETSQSEGLSSSAGLGYIDTPATTDPIEKSSTGTNEIHPTTSADSLNQHETRARLGSISTVSFKSDLLLVKSQTAPSSAPLEKRPSRWKSKLSTSKKGSSKSSGDSSSLSSTTLEAQKLDEISLKNLVNIPNVSNRGRSAKNINVALSQNSTYVLFWTQACINIWDIGTSSSPILGRAVSTGSSCVLAAATKVHLAYVIGTRDGKLTLRIVNLIEATVPVIEYRMPSSLWCHSICICPSENYVVVGFDHAIVRFFKLNGSTEPREDRLHARVHGDCKNCPPVETLSFSNDGLILLASTRNAKNGIIQVYSWRFPFENVAELVSCRYHVPLHESEDNGISSVIPRSGIGGEEDLVCITTWTQSGIPMLIQPRDGYRSPIKSSASSHHGRLESRIQSAAFSPTGRELALVNAKGDLYYISSIKANPMEIKRIATSKEFTLKTDSFAMTFMSPPGEEAIILAWTDSAKATGYVKKIPIKYSVHETPVAVTPLTPAGPPLTPRYELASEGTEISKPMSNWA